MTPQYKRNAKLIVEYISSKYDNVIVYTKYKIRKMARASANGVPFVVIVVGRQSTGTRAIIRIYKKNVVGITNISISRDLRHQFPHLRVYDI